MRPRPGTDRQAIIVMLRQSAVEARNVVSASIGAIRLRDDYLQWADRIEWTLGQLFVGFRLTDLQTERFWHIREIREETPRPYELIYPEVELQARRLERLADELESAETRHRGAAGHIVVPDTNVFLHFKRFNTINWGDVVGMTPVRLVIPLRVVEELDMKKASRRRDLASRAQNVLALLELLVGSIGGLPAKVDDETTVEILVNHELDPVRHDREPSADAEVLDACEFLAFVTGEPVSLVTGDVSMRLRARVRGQTAISMPDALRATLDTPSPD